MTVSLSEGERQKVRMYLGFGRGRDIHPRLETRFDGWLSSEEYAQVTDTLTKLDALETQIASSSPVASANTANGNVREVIGEVSFFGADNNMAVVEMIYQRGRTLVRRLSIIFEIEPNADYFSASGAPSGGMLTVG